MTTSAKISAVTGQSKQLDVRAAPREVVTEEDVQQPKKLAELLGRILVALTELRRRWAPRKIDFEDQPVGTSTDYRFEHRFGGRVRWWVVDWKPAFTGVNQYIEFMRHADTDENVLVLTSGAASVGTVTVRVEEAG